MVIRRLSASFGKLSGSTLELSDGLNIIEAPNEAGKSTWCSFIKAMLYGVRTSDRDKTGYLSDKTRFRPWSGSPMEGSMDVEVGGALLTLQRTSDGRLPMRNFSAFYTGTGQPFPGLSADNAGEALLGVSEAVFERSAFISQAGLKVTPAPELERRISAMVTTGDESSSYSEADARLRKWQRKLKFNQTGTIPALEEKLRKARRELERIESALDEAASLRLEAERLAKRKAELEGELESCVRFETQQSMRRALIRYERAKADHDALFRELAAGGPPPSESDLLAIRSDLKALDTLDRMLAVRQRELEEAEERRDEILSQKSASPFDRPGGERVVDEAASLEARLKRLSPRGVAGVLLIILTLAAAVVAALIPGVRLPLFAAAAVGLFAFSWQIYQFSGTRRKLRSLLSDFGAYSTAELRERCSRHAEISASLIDAESAVRAAEAAVGSVKSMYEEAKKSLAERLEACSLPADPEVAAGELTRVEALLSRLTAAKSEMQAAEGVISALKAQAPLSQADFSEPEPPPARRREEIAAELKSVSLHLEDVTTRYNIALGEARAMGDPVVLGSEILKAESDLALQQAQHKALSLAIDTLRDASSELQSRFSPLLADTASRILARLTGGRYERLTFDRAFDAYAKTPGETVSRSVLSLSTGTVDQVYLALRLAVCELVLPKDNPCPLILDDALSNFDDYRARLALDYFHELARSRQILLFTCRGREAAHFSGAGDVAVIRL